MMLAMVGCELAPAPQRSPTPPEDAFTDTPAPSPTATSVVLTDTPLPPTPQVATEPPTIAPTPSETFTPSPTWNPIATYVIQPDDSLLFIIQRPPFNYRTGNVIDEILRLNPNVPNPNQLPPPGSIIQIPLPSLTPTPEGFEMTVAANPNLNAVIQGVSQTTQIEVREGITILGIAGQANTNLPIIATLNPQLQFINCDFSNPSGGEGCNVPLRVGDLVNVPAPTPTPTLSPTFSGLETATPTPTYAPPVAVFPGRDFTAPGRTFPIQWVSAGILQENEVYMIEIIDDTAGTPAFLDITRGTTYQLPESLVPTDGQTHTIRWRILIGKPNEQGTYRVISPQSEYRTFYWQSR